MEEKNIKKRYDPTDILYAVSGSFVTLCYIIYFVSCAAKAMFSSLFLPALVIAMVIVPVLLRGRIKKILKKFYKAAKIIYICGMCFYMITFLIFSGVILTRSQTYKSEQKDDRQIVVIVFGCRTKGYTPSITLANRLDRASEILEENPDAICIVSGSQGANETVSEAESMKKYLVEKCSISSNRVIEEDRANNSIENLAYSLEIIEKEGLDARLICVSSEFHTPRIMLLARRAGVQVETAGAASSSIPSLCSNLVREYMAYVKLFVFGG